MPRYTKSLFSHFFSTAKRRKIRRLGHLEQLEQRVVMSAVPAASLAVPPDPFLGEQLDFTVAFDNTSSVDTGYGPYVDLILPATGRDGAGSEIDDGISFLNATYLGVSVNSTSITFDSTGHAVHPYARDSAGNSVVVNGVAGDQLVVLELPFGSFTPTQPAAVINVSAQISNRADADRSLDISAKAGFRYGNDPLDNPTVDGSLLGTLTTASTTPRLLKLRKEYLGPEDETATGPNFPRQYRIVVDIANGQTITNLNVSDLLASNAQFIGVDATAIRGTPTSTVSVITPSTSVPGGFLTRRFNSVTGTTADNDAELLFRYYIPLNDSNLTPVINAISGDDAISIDDARADGSWTPIDSPRDPAGTVTSDVTTIDHTLIPKSIAIQKSVSNLTDGSNSAGDTLEYALNFQVSDYFAFQNIVITDIFSDGQDFIPGSITLSLSDGHASTLTNAVMNSSNVTLTSNFSGGQDRLIFRLSDELVARSFSTNGRLVGGAIPNGGTGGSLPQSAFPLPFSGTVGTIRFQTRIRDSFQIDFPSGDASVDQGDILTNTVTIRGDLISVADLTTPTGQSEEDTSAASVQIARGTLEKTIYAVNGSTTLPNPLVITPGDTVTYRISATMPSSDLENFSLNDFLPLPIFVATELTTFDDVVSSAAPAAGHAKFGPTDTFRSLSGIVPTRTVDSVGNSIQFNFGNFDDPLNRATRSEILFTVTATNVPFADGLYLTNQVRESEGSTNSGDNTQDVIVQIRLTEPVLNITKGVVSTNDAATTFSPSVVGPVTFSAPGTTGVAFSGIISSNQLAVSPIDSDVSGLQAGDLVRFAIIVENTGNSRRGAFDVDIRDTLPAGFSIPAGGLNLQVTDGTGAAYGFTRPDGTSATTTDLFSTGIRLADPGPTSSGTASANAGAIDGYHGTSGRNLVVLTYDLRVNANVEPTQAILNTATLTHYASLEGGPDFTTTDISDDATATIRNVSPVKSIVATSEAFTPDIVGGVPATPRPVAIGEIVRYHLTVEVPESFSANFQIVDALHAGLTFLNDGTSTVAFVSNSGGLTSSTLTGAGINVSGATGTVTPTFVLPSAAISGGVTFSLGDITNSDFDADKEYVVLEFNALVNNSASGSNDAGDLRNNSIFVRIDGGSVASSPNSQLKIVEPSITNVLKTAVSPSVSADTDASYTVTFSNPTGSNATTAFDVRLTDTIPTGLSLTLASISISSTGTVGAVTNASSGNDLDITFASMAPGSTVTVTYTARVSSLIAAGTPLVNTANVRYSSLPGNQGTTSNPTGSQVTGLPGSNSGERDGSGSPGHNDYFDSDSETVTAVPPSLTKVATATSHSGTASDQFSPATSDLTIGETVTYTITTTVTEGRTPTTIIDNLPTANGILAVVSSRVVSIGANISGSLLNVSDSGSASDVNLIDSYNDRVVFNFGTLTNTPDHVITAADLIVVEVVARLVNTAANQNGDVLTNSAYVDYGLSTSSRATADVEVVAPDLSIDKSSVTLDVDANDLVTYTTRIRHTSASTANAYALSMTDTLDSRFTLIPGSVTTTSGTIVTGNTSGDSAIRIDIPAFLITDTDIVITYQARVKSTAAPDDTLPNTANLSYDTLPGGGGRLATRSDGHSVTVNSSTLSGRVWYDSNNDGVYDGAASGISGVTVQLVGADHLGNNVTLTTVTNASGLYSFSNLRPGTYSVVETQPAGYLDGIDKRGLFSGTIGSGSNTGTVGPDQFTSIVIAAGSRIAATTYDFGEILPATLSGFVYDDRNNDGLFAAESGITDVIVTLRGVDDLGQSIDRSVRTGVGGAYSFGDLRPSDSAGYTITETQPTPYIDGKETIGTLSGTIGSDVFSHLVVTSGLAGLNYNFGELVPASLSGFVYHDVNHDGLYDGAASGIQNAVVTLTGQNDLGVNITLTAVTQLDGSYRFDNLRPSGAAGYSISETQPSGYLDGLDTLGTTGGTLANDQISAIVLLAGVNGAQNNFGEVVPASISGRVYLDRNNNGSFDPGTETGIGNVTVTLTGLDDLGATVNIQVSTNADGTYSFAGLRPGTYTVTETQPSDFLDGRDSVGNSGGTLSNDTITAIELTSGELNSNLDFGELPPSSLSGVVYHDFDNNGLWDGTQYGIAGTTVTLTGVDDRGVLVTYSQVTQSDGSYRFANLRPSNIAGYTITEVQPASHLDGRDSIGTPGGTTANDRFSAIVLTAGVDGINHNFGELLPSSISGRVYRDLNNDGVYGSSPENGIAGVNVTLNGINDLGVTVTVVLATNADGTYAFNTLRPGVYSISESQPTGYLDGRDAPGNSGGTVSNDFIQGITLDSGEIDTELNFGELPPSSLSGYVYHDAHNDGVWSGSGSGIPNVTVTLSGRDDLGNIVTLSTVTQADGAYLFADLRPSSPAGYRISETQPMAYLDGRDSIGSPGGIATNDQFASIVLNANIDGVDNNFGEIRPASLSGRVYRDLNNDGLFGGSPETGISAVLVTLTGTDDLGTDISITVTTSLDGTYTFTGLRPGNYQVSESQPIGYLDGKDSAGNSFGSISNDSISAITVSSGDVVNEVNFGELPPSSLSGFVYHDLDNNGIWDGIGLGIPNVTVILTGTDDLGNTVSQSGQTQADGSYQFLNLRPSGTQGYTLTEIQPNQYLDGTDTVGTPGGTITNDSFSQITLGASVNGVNNNFGELVPARISGTVYRDLNNNGFFDSIPETGIEGTVVTLSGTTDLGVAITVVSVTTASGTYSFTGLRPGSYTVTETQSAGFFDGKDSIGNSAGTLSNDVISNIALTSGENNSDLNFGELPPSSLSGFVYHDTNNDGNLDVNENGINGVTVTLTGQDDLGHAVFLSTTTGGNGAYNFGMLRPSGPAGYTMIESQPTGYIDGRDTAGSAGGVSTNDLTQSIFLNASTDATDYRFGELLPATISGRVFRDLNNDGIFTATSETGIGGAQVLLTGTDDLGKSVSTVVITFADGTYSFTELRPGTYIVSESQPIGLFDGLDSAGNSAGSLSNDRISNIVLASGQIAAELNFGELPPSSLSGIVYHDANNDGALSVAESGISGVTLTLTGRDDLGNNIAITTTTNSSGLYQFLNLRPSGVGGYTITESQPASYLDGKDQTGSAGGVRTDDRVSEIALLSDVHGSDYLFGELLPASLSGRVYRDVNNDGQFDGTSETGVYGAVVTLTGIDDLGNGVTNVTLTNPDGTYAFTSLRPGIYAVNEIQPTGLLDGKDAVGTSGGDLANDAITHVILNSDQRAINLDFGELPPSSLAGNVYHDVNNDGLYDGQALGIANVTVNLTGFDDLGTFVNLTTLTSSTGEYQFSNLRPSNGAGYRLTEFQPSGYFDGRDTVGTPGGTTSNDNFNSIVLRAATDGVQNNFGELLPASIAGRVYSDLNNDGNFDNSSESGINGVSVTLNGTDDRGVAVSLSSNTKPDGTYLFADLRPGVYTIQESQPAGLLDGKDSFGNSNGTLSNDLVSNIVLTSNLHRSEVNFGELLPASVSGTVYRDLDNNGVFASGSETGIDGVSVVLTGTDDRGGFVNLTMTTDPQGAYQFSNLRPGTYVIHETQPQDFLDGKENAGDSNGTVSNDTISNVVLGAGIHRSALDFGELPPSTLSGFVYHDADNDGSIDGSEAGIANVTVRLTGNDDLGNPVNLTTTTLANGGYGFTNLRPSSVTGYRIAETQPSEFLDGVDTLGSTGGSVLDDVFAEVLLRPATAGTRYNFGELRPASITGTVYEDRDFNGVKDGTTESGIANVSLTLTGTDDLGKPVQIHTTTSQDGSYIFPSLRPGIYHLAENQPNGFLDGLDSTGNTGGVGANDAVSNIVLVSGESNTGVDFGELLPSSLSGRVFRDLNDDGIFNGQEIGFSDVIITLTGTTYLGAPVHIVTTTAADGTYQFANLLPGTYILTETQPDGVGDGKDSIGLQGGTVLPDQFRIVLGTGVQGTGNNFAELPFGDLSITKVNDDTMGLALSDGSIRYTIVVRNTGPGIAKNAIVADDLPDTIIKVAAWTAVGTAGTVYAAKGNGDLVDAVTIPAGGSIEYHLTVTLNGTFRGILTNTATVTPPDNGTFVDTNNSNNSARANTEVRDLNLRLITANGQSALNVTGLTSIGCVYTLIAGTKAGRGRVNGVEIGIADPSIVGKLSGTSLNGNIIFPASLLKKFKSKTLLLQVIETSTTSKYVSEVLKVTRDDLFPPAKPTKPVKGK